MTSIEDQLREALRASGVNVRQIGEEAEVDYGQIYRFLGGRAELRSRTFARLCEWANLTLVTRGQDPAAPDWVAIHRERYREIAQLAREIDRLASDATV